MTIAFLFEIVGGPKDGSTGRYEGETMGASVPSIITKMAQLEMDGHKYRITSFDQEKMHAVLEW